MRLFYSTKKNKTDHEYLHKDLTIHNLTEEMKFVENEIEKVLLKHGFLLVMVKLAHGNDEIKCYNLGDLYCRISFMKNYTNRKELKDWVLIEYADSLSDASVWAYEDGNGVPLDLPLEQIIACLEKELISNLK